MDSRFIVFDLAEERGTALGATTKYSGGGEWIVHGDLTSVSDSASYGDHLSFTSCELEEPHYHFLTKNAKIVRGNLMVARPVILYFADVPVAWLPFMVQNLESGRSSGLLTPTFSVNDIVRASSSYNRRVSNIGFFWAMSDYFDTMLFLDWFSGEHTALTGAFRYNWARQFLQGSLNLRRFWREGGSKALALSANSRWQVSERTDLRFRASYASSTSMIRETSFDPQEVVQSIDSEGGVSHRFGFGNLSLSANRRQYLSDDRVEMTLPNLQFLPLPPDVFPGLSGSGPLLQQHHLVRVGELSEEFHGTSRCSGLGRFLPVPGGSGQDLCGDQLRAFSGRLLPLRGDESERDHDPGRSHNRTRRLRGGGSHHHRPG